MQDNSSVLIVLGVAILAAVFVIATSVRPDEATISPEQKALIAKHELMPGLTRETAIDVIATDFGIWEESGWVVYIEDAVGPKGSASIDSRMTPKMVIASWGTPNAIADLTSLPVEVRGERLPKRRDSGQVYIYRQPPNGEIHVQFNGENVARFVDTVLSPEYFKRRFPAWTDKICELVAAEKLSLGMTRQITRASWGIPSDINHSVGSWGEREQWVYRSALSGISTKYLYFENGILTSWQY